MPKLFPFRGYRYCQQSCRLSDVVTQPYDKISPEARLRYLGLSPYNVAHVISNPDYRTAGKNFLDWIQQGILKQDSNPGLYVYRQTFRVGESELRRTGVIGLLDLGQDGSSVLRHERVMDAPLLDRLNLIGATESNDGLIFMLLEDQAGNFESKLTSALDDRLPLEEVEDEFGVLNQVWQVTEPSGLETVQSLVASESFYIADGHHRFETAIRYAQSCRVRNWRPTAVESFDKRMVALFSAHSPGVVILPTHRAIRGLDPAAGARVLPHLEKGFAISEKPSAELLVEAMQEAPGRIGLLLGSPTRCILLEERGARSGLPPDLTGTARLLDVNLLHRGILEPLLGIGEAELSSQKHVDYYRDYREILPGLVCGKYSMAFLLNPTSTDQVIGISQEGGRMPQKSTDFFPKLLTGLVFMKMQIDRGDYSSAGSSAVAQVEV